MDEKNEKEMPVKSKSRLRKILTRGVPIVLLVFVVGIISFSLWIELHIKKLCAEATQKYPGDKIEALMKSVQTETYGYRANIYSANNHIFWALGQLGDKRALPFLKKLATSQPCDHETNLCQGEIQEGIQKLEKNGFNLPAFLFRRVLN